MSILNLQRKLYSKLNKKQSLRKVVKLLCISPKTSHQVEKYVQSYSSDNCTQFYNVEILSLFDPELQLKNVEYTIKNKLKELLSKFKKLKVQKVLVLSYKKSNDCKTFHSSSNLIVSYSDIEKAFISMHQSIATKKYGYTDWIVLDILIKHSINIFECYYKENNQHKKMDVTSNFIPTKYLFSTLGLRMTPFGVLRDKFSFDHFLATSYFF